MNNKWKVARVGVFFLLFIAIFGLINPDATQRSYALGWILISLYMLHRVNKRLRPSTNKPVEKPKSFKLLKNK